VRLKDPETHVGVRWVTDKYRYPACTVNRKQVSSVGSLHWSTWHHIFSIPTVLLSALWVAGRKALTEPNQTAQFEGILLTCSKLSNVCLSQYLDG